MLAVVALGGKQYNVTVGTKFQTEKIDLAEGKTFSIEEVLMVSEEDGNDFKIGMPLLKDEKVEAKILSHGKGDKIRVFKMKAKKRYSKVQGHRQRYTEVEIVSIGGQKAKPTAKAKAPAAAKKTPAVKKSVTNAKKTDTIVSAKSEKVKPAAKKVTKKAAPKTTTASASAKATVDKKKTTTK